MTDLYDFRFWLHAEHYAPATVRNYTNYVARAMSALGSLHNQDTEALAAWCRSLTDGCARGARKALIAYYTFRRARTNPARTIPVKPAVPGTPRPLTPAQRERFLVAAEQLGGAHRTVGFLFAFTGARFSSVRFAHWRAFDLNDDDPTWTLLGKGANRSGPRKHTIELHPLLVRVLRQWRLTSRGPAVFPGTSAGGVIGENALRDLHAEICALAGINGATPHRHRHTVGTLIYEDTGDLGIVQSVLGHASPSSARIYAEIPRRRVRQAIEALPGAAVAR